MKKETLINLREKFGPRLKEEVNLSSYTSTRVGGPASASLLVTSIKEITEVVQFLWDKDIPFSIIGGGSNLLVSDQGIDGFVIINRSRDSQFFETEAGPHAKADSGATMNDLAQKAANLGFAGFEWAASIPGTLGGAIYGNAGAFNGEISGNLVSVELLIRGKGTQTWSAEEMEYSYRSSILKRNNLQAVVLSAELFFVKSTAELVRKTMDENAKTRKTNQPKGASFGSIFKNPPGDYAGRLIEAAGLKGKRIGNAQISTKHANFIINQGDASANDIYALILLAQQVVKEQFNVNLDMEIEFLGEWN